MTQAPAIRRTMMNRVSARRLPVVSTESRQSRHSGGTLSLLPGADYFPLQFAGCFGTLFGRESVTEPSPAGGFRVAACYPEPKRCGVNQARVQNSPSGEQERDELFEKCPVRKQQPHERFPGNEPVLDPVHAPAPWSTSHLIGQILLCPSGKTDGQPPAIVLSSVSQRKTLAPSGKMTRERGV